MNIIRGSTYSKKNAETVCIHCGKTFISKKNHKKHTDKYHQKGATNRVVKGKKKN